MASSSSMPPLEDIPKNDEIEVSSGDDSDDMPAQVKTKVATKKKDAKNPKSKTWTGKIHICKISKKKHNLRAPCWEHFEPFTDPDDMIFKGRCFYCNKIYKADGKNNGTSMLKRHLVVCEFHPENIEKKLHAQSKLLFKKNVEDGEGNSGSVEKWIYDEKRIWRAVLNLFVLAELPFSLIRHPALVELVEALSPFYKLPSRWTASRGVLLYYQEEKKKLHDLLSKSTQGVHLTTDTWTSSNQRVNYMVLTAHFIDDDWCLHKRIINFKPIHSHKGTDIGIEVFNCIKEWDLKNVMTMSVDNASSNDVAIKYLIKKLPDLFNDGKNFQVRCMAHILNLIVKDGMDEYIGSIDVIRMAVRYIKNSTQRITKFQSAIVESKCASKKFLCTDCPTRWNSTFDMLKTALELKDAFALYECQNSNFVADLIDVPCRDDWVNVQFVVDFLEKFKLKTELISGSSYPVAHKFYLELLDIDLHLRTWADKVHFVVTVGKMQDKFAKYWGALPGQGDLKGINMFMYFAIILDPIYKLDVIEYGFRMLLGYDRKPETTDAQFKVLVDTQVTDVEKSMEALYNTYKHKFDSLEKNSSAPSSSSTQVASSQDGNSVANAFLFGTRSVASKVKSEFKKYIDDPREQPYEGYDILRWWKLNAQRYPILSRMAKDILAIQVSTVASESAFSTGGRILDPYRTRLSASIVEALICTQDWVRKSKKVINMLDEVEDLQKDEEVALEVEKELKKMSISGKQVENLD